MASRVAFLGMVPVVFSAVVLVLVKLRVASPTSPVILAGGALALLVPFAGALHAALRQRPKLEGVLALDRHHGLSGRLSSALAFSEVPAAERSPFMDAAIEDALGFVKDLTPSKAAPLRFPKDGPVLLLLSIGTLSLAFVEVRIPRPPPAPSAHVEGLSLDADDIDLFRKASEDAAQTARDPETSSGARRLNQLIEDIAGKRVQRDEVFRRLDEIERHLAVRSDHESGAADDALNGMARELAKSTLAKPLAEALEEKRLADAEQALRDLAKKIADAKEKVDRDKLDALRKSMQKAAEIVQHDPASKDSEQKAAEEERQQLLKKKAEQGLTKSEEQKLDKLERKLERLQREKSQREARSRELSGLDRDLAKAAQDLMKDLGESAQDMNQGAEDIHRYADRRLSEEQKKELKKRVEELRQILRQEGQAGKERIRRMLSFSQRARGQQGQGKGSGQGQGEGQGRGKGQEGQGQGQRMTLGRGAPGSGDGVMILPGGTMPGPGGTEKGDEGPGGGGKGEKWGEGHDPTVAGDATRLAGKTEDVTATAADTGEGASASRVIYGAAERGFTGRGYKKVFTDYQNVAEQTLNSDEVPPGYRFYVKRYFQLIRPRD